MKKQAILSLLVFVVAVCGCSSDYLSDQRRQANKCAENWKTQGFNFDPNSMTCSQMRQRVQTIRRAEYWRNKGYVLDPNSLTKEEMDIKVKDIDRARYWKKRGYEFDPYKMTRYEMNRQAKELDKIKYYKKAGYYYDPNSQTVFLTAHKKTKLESLASLHGGRTTVSTIPLTDVYRSTRNLSPVPIGTSGSGKTYLFTGGGHWVNKIIDSGNFVKLEDSSLWQVSPIDRINCSLWLYTEEIAVVESQNPYYPYLLINTDDGEKVEAKLISD